MTSSPTPPEDKKRPIQGDIQIGFDSFSEQGPGIFLSRLKAELETRNRYNEETPDVWILLPFQTVPDAIQTRVRLKQTKILLRLNGCYCMRHYTVRKPFTLPLPILDTLRSKRVNARKNAQIRHNFALADHIIYQSHFSKKLTETFVKPTTQPPAGESIILNGIPLSHFFPSNPTASGKSISDNSPLAPFSDRLNILVSHSFRPYHRLHDSFRILAQYNKTYPDRKAHLHILGDDDNSGSFKYAKTIAQQLALQENEDYTFWDKQHHSQLPPFYQGCDMMLNLSYWDSCPNVVVEAMASGLPVVGVNHGGVAELVSPHPNHTAGGTLVSEKIPFTYIDHMSFERMPKAPIKAYVKAIETTAQNTVKLSQLARAHAEVHFDIRDICDAYLTAAERTFWNPAE